MDYQEAIKEAEIQIDMYEGMILYNKDFEPKNNNSNYERKMDFLKTTISAIQELQQYEEIGTLEEVREAVELQQADKPRIFRLSIHGAPDGYLYSCPNCEYRIIKKDNRGFYSGPRTKYCPDCGKRLNWGEEDD